MNIVAIRQTTMLFSALFIIVGMACNAMFYWDFASSTLPRIIYVALGLGFDGFKVLLLPMAYLFFVVLRRPFMATISVAVWICLTSISLIAAYGFFTTVQDNAERKELVASSYYKMLNQTIANSTEQMERNAQYANIDVPALELQVNTLQAGIRERRSHPFFNDQNPINKRRLQVEIDSLESELQPLLVQLKGAQLYQTAAEERKNALGEISELNSEDTRDVVLNPMFIAMGKQLEMEGEAVKRAILTFTAFATELLGTFAALVAVMLYHNEGHRTSNPQPYYGHDYGRSAAPPPRKLGGNRRNRLHQLSTAKSQELVNWGDVKINPDLFGAQRKKP